MKSYLACAFGKRLADVRAAMETLADTMPLEELNRLGFGLHERFRPNVPEGVVGWGDKGTLYLDRVRSAAE